LRELPEANTIEPEALGGAVVLNRIDDRVPEALRRAAGAVGTGAVRRTATVGGNLIGSTLRCLLPAALVLETRATLLEEDRIFEADLADVLEQRPVLLSIRWRVPVTSAYRKLTGEAAGEPPVTVAAAVHADDEGRHRLRVAVRNGYDVTSESTPCGAGGAGLEDVLRALEGTALGALPPTALDAVRGLVTEVLSRPADE
jgi:CO/xanthine dehydrogenase FAD-binding subunit